MVKNKVKKLTMEQTYLETWFERDRAHVELRERDTDRTIIEWWDEDVYEAIEDGFLDHRAFIMGKLRCEHTLHCSAFEYAQDIGLC
jgi:hypothetical protein